MPKISARRLAQRSYEAFAAGDRKFFVQHLAENFTFSSPLDVGSIVPAIFRDAGQEPGRVKSSTFCV
jgi:hypothetical protein